MSILTREALACAQRLNLYYSRRLGWPLPAAFRDVQSADFAYYIARLQRDSKCLNTDGIMGPKTYAWMRRKTWVPPTDNTMVLGGDSVAVPFPVVTFENPEGLSFYGQDGWDTRSDPTGAKVDLIVFHWDECISAHHCFHTLLARRLSAHFLIDGDGTVYQTLDPCDTRPWHARQFNDRAIGIEIQNPVTPNVPAPYGPRRPLVAEIQPHTPREWLHLDFTPLQKERAVALCEILCQHFAIPRALPQGEAGVLTSLMPAPFKGVCGHYHLTTDKVDPGLSLWPSLLSQWGPSNQHQVA